MHKHMEPTRGREVWRFEALRWADKAVYIGGRGSVQYADGKHSTGGQAASARFRRPVDLGRRSRGPRPAAELSLSLACVPRC